MTKPKKWVRNVKTVSTYPPRDVFTKDAQTIARTMAKKSVSPRGIGSGIRMIQYFINRAGKNLTTARKRELEKAKRILQKKRESTKSAAKSARTQPAMNPSNFFVIVLALVGISVLLASRFDPEARAASSPIGPGSPSAANAQLEKAVKSMFAHDEQVRSADLDVRADVTKNEVTLSGTVASEAVRSRAVELAKTAHVGVVVNDKMTVKPRR